MISLVQRNARARRQQGYALLMVVFLTTALLIAAVMVAPNILTDGKREKEKEMIWRGKQYVRGIKLYYRKTGHFPTSIDDLTKPKIGSLRFMRQAYKDPMNKEDGSWRLIYVGPAGQLIGSLKPPQQALSFGQTPISGPSTAGNGLGILGGSGGLGNLGQGSGQQSTFGVQSSGFGQQSQSGTQPGSTTPGTNLPGGTGTPVSTDQGTGPGSQAQTGDTPTIIGGSIIGVGSKIDKPSVIYYDKAKKYLLFEFIWDPSKDMMVPGQQGTPIGTPINSGIGGQTPGQPVNP